MDPVIEAIAMLTPYDIDKPKIRVGPKGDGGYVFVDDLSSDQAVMSYGIGGEYRLDLEFADRGHQVFMFDHTIPSLGALHANARHFQEGVAASSSEAQQVYSIADHLTRHTITGDRLILKMDVEGAEFDALNAIPEDILLRFEQIALEVHSLDFLAEPSYRRSFTTLFRRLNRHYTLFHVHANNFDGPDAFAFVGGLAVPRLIEVSYIRSSVVVRRQSQTLYPTSLDYPNTPQRDKLLWLFPFMPNNVHSETFAYCAERVKNFNPVTEAT